jgi:tRNA-Thr(GGU) m(6)t(6)A37 methyltransferase TsaA
MKFALSPVAFVQADRQSPEDDFWGGERARIVLHDDYDPDAFAGLDAFSHIEVLFLFHQVDEARIVTGARHPRNNPDWPKVGIFAQRGKNRPNRVGSTICRLLDVQGRVLTVSELDAIDGTPVLDIKPVFREFLPRESSSQPAWVGELMSSYWERN